MRLRRAAVLALGLSAVALPVAGAQRVEEAPIPALKVQGADDPLSQVAFGTVSFALDRPGYAALFEYSRDGRVRVLYPTQPSDTAPVLATTAYHARAWSPDFIRQESATSSVASRVPFVFVLTSNQPFDLSRFGGGKRWTRQLVPKSSSAQPDRLIADVAELVLGEKGVYEYEFGYLAPRMTAHQQIALYRCVSRFDLPQDDYWSYHDLWLTVTPDPFSIGRFGVFASSFANPWMYSSAGFAARLSPSCGGGAPMPMFVGIPSLGSLYAAYNPVPRPGEPAPPVTPRPPVDSAAPSEPTPDGSIVEPPVRKPGWRDDYRPPTAPRRGGPGVGATQPVDPPASPEELRKKWLEERLARRPQNADAANLYVLRQTNRLMAKGLPREQAEEIAGRWARQRLTPGYDDLRRTWGSSRSDVVERQTRSAARRETQINRAELRDAARPRAEGAQPERSGPPTSRQGASAPSASSENAPTQARGDQPKKGQ